jgi:hypothetical protein
VLVLNGVADVRVAIVSVQLMKPLSFDGLSDRLRYPLAVPGREGESRDLLEVCEQALTVLDVAEMEAPTRSTRRRA